MSSKNIFGNEGSDVQNTNQQSKLDEFGRTDELDVKVVEEVKLHASVEQEIQGKVDTNHPDALGRGLTLEAQERMEAREWEIGRTHDRHDRRQESSREARTQRAVTELSTERRNEFQRRAASIDPWSDPDRADPRVELSQTELAAVNEQTGKLAKKLDGWSRAAISRRLAERIVDGAGLMGAVIGVLEELERAPGQVVPISAVEDVPRREVSITGTVTQLWKPSHPRIRQVGLLEDDSGTIKFTSWAKSQKTIVTEGERVTMRNVAKNWYEGRVSVALTGWSTISFPERGRWWE